MLVAVSTVTDGIFSNNLKQTEQDESDILILSRKALVKIKTRHGSILYGRNVSTNELTELLVTKAQIISLSHLIIHNCANE